jgi:hypothetical protein
VTLSEPERQPICEAASPFVFPRPRGRPKKWPALPDSDNRLQPLSDSIEALKELDGPRTDSATTVKLYRVGWQDASDGFGQASVADAYRRGFYAGQRFRHAISGKRQRPAEQCFPAWPSRFNPFPVTGGKTPPWFAWRKGAPA